MKNKIILLALLIATVINIQAQETNFLQGAIFELNENGIEEELPGVNVYWARTTIGVSSDENGIFRLAFPNNTTPLLVCSFVGYQNDSLLIAPERTEPIKIVLSVNRLLKEVVIHSRSTGTYISRMETRLTQLISTNQLQKAACCNLSESFETDASIDVSFSDAVSGAKQIKMLGLDGVYCQIMTENIPNIRGLASSYGLGYIPGSWMESILISKGTASVKNGYESITGQINTEYFKPDNSDPFFFNAYVNDLGKYEGNLYSSKKINEYLSTMIFAHAENFNNSVDRNDDGFLDEPMMDQISIFNRWKYNKNKIRAQIGIKLIHENREGGQSIFDHKNASNNASIYGFEINTKRLEVFSKNAFLFEKEGTNIGIINSFIYHQQESFFGLSEYDANQIHYTGNLMFQTTLGCASRQLTSGISFLLDHYDELLNDSSFLRKENVPGLFVEYTKINEERYSYIIGLRTDFHNLYGLLITPRVHFKYNIDESLIFRVSAGKGYRSANIYAENSFILANTKSIIIQEEPQIEEAWNYGINASKYFKIKDRELSLNIEFYRTDFMNQMVIDRDQDFSKIYIYNLNGKSYSNSAQISLNYELFKGLDILAAFRYSDVKVTTNGNLQQKPLVNKYKGLLNLSYATPIKNWQFDFTTQFNGDSRIPYTGANPIEYRLSEDSPTYVLLNAQITKYFNHWEVYAGGENLTNFKQENPILAANDPFGEYFDSSLIWGPITGRKFYLGIRYRIK